MKKLTKKTFINQVMSKGYVRLDNEDLYYAIAQINEENFPDMNDKLKNQLQEEGKYNSWIGIISENLCPPYSITNLPIYGDPDKYITHWFENSMENAINNDLLDRPMKLLSRANKHIEI